MEQEMRGTLTTRYLLCLFSVTLLVACAPAAPGPRGEVAGSGPATVPPNIAPSPPAASTPSAIEVQAFQQQIVDVHRDMLWVLQHMAALDPQRQQRLGAMMVDLMAEETSLLASMQAVVE